MLYNNSNQTICRSHILINNSTACNNLIRNMKPTSHMEATRTTEKGNVDNIKRKGLLNFIRDPFFEYYSANQLILFR